MTQAPDAPRADCSSSDLQVSSTSDLWSLIEADWDNSELHSAYLALCQTAADLARAAGKYRPYLEEPGRKAVAEAQLKRIAAAAMAHLEVARTVRVSEAPSRPYGKVLLIVLFLLGSALLFRLL